MKHTFSDRVKSERKVLGWVNEACLEPTLNGLSRAAIESWESSNPHATSRLAGLLQSIARKVQMEVDTSKDVFDSDAKTLESVDFYLRNLRRELEAIGVSKKLGT